MKNKILTIAMIFATLPSAYAAIAQTGQISVADCEANNNPFVEDICHARNLSTAENCQVRVHSQNGNPETLEISSRAWLQEPGSRIKFDANIHKLYEINGARSYSKHQLKNIGDLIGGDVTLALPDESKRVDAMKVEIYFNHDSSGSNYTRYRCEL